MLVLIHKECGGPALDESPVGEVCAIPIDRFPFACFTCLEEIDDGVWNVYFGPLKLGRLLERQMRIEDQYGRLKRHHWRTAARSASSEG
jgi:hypothetical protein